MIPTPATPALPDYIRVFARADHSAAGKLALEYTKSILRIAPVRVIPVGMGIWPGYEPLLKPLDGTFVNVVACGPDQWCRLIRIEAPKKVDPFVGDGLRSTWETDGCDRSVYEKPKAELEVISEHPAGSAEAGESVGAPKHAYPESAVRLTESTTARLTMAESKRGRGCLRTLSMS